MHFLAMYRITNLFASINFAINRILILKKNMIRIIGIISERTFLLVMHNL